MISIRRCALDDIHILMKFIEENWGRHHILAHNKKLVDWQHATEDGYNFILAWDGHLLVGALGYIPIKRYDSVLCTENIIWLALWKVREDYQSSMVGLRLLSALTSMEPSADLAVNGINAAVEPIYKALGYKVVELSQYYLVNRYLKQKILKYPRNFCLPEPSIGIASLRKLLLSDLDKLTLPKNSIPRWKTPKYFIERFIQHPFYNYHLFAIEHKSTVFGVLATRNITYRGSIIIRIVDFVGDENMLAECGSALQNLMIKVGAEYTDFWNFGILPNIFFQAGFRIVKADGALTCPNYFEPFEPRNTRLFCAFKVHKDKPFFVCKADGDQDRPSSL